MVDQTDSEAKKFKKEEPVAIKKSVEVKYRELLTELIDAVANKGMKLSHARNELHEWVELLDDPDKSALSQSIIGASKRIADIAQALASEEPSLRTRLTPNQNI